jgi:hypothetical protein
MDSNQQAVIHHIHRLQKHRSQAELPGQLERPLFRSNFEPITTVDPVEVLENGSRVSRSIFSHGLNITA